MNQPTRFFFTAVLSAVLTLGAAMTPAIADDADMCPGMGMMRGGMMGPEMMDGMMGSGMMGGMAGQGMMGGMMGRGMMMGLDLTDDQRAKVEKINYEIAKKHMELMAVMLEESHKLREALAMKTPNPAAVGNATIRIHDLKRQMKQLHVDTHNRIEAVLTKEQQEMFRRHGRGGMMGH